MIERNLRTPLNDRSIGERVGKWHADLDHIGSRAFEASKQRDTPFGIGMSSRYIADERFATVCASRGKARGQCGGGCGQVRRNSR